MQTKPPCTRKILLLVFAAASLVAASVTARADDYNNGRQIVSAVIQASKASRNIQSAASATKISTDVVQLVVEESCVQRAQKLFSNVSDKASDVVLSALNYIGVRYKYGGNTPDSGLDCSGFVRYVFQDTLNFMLPRRSEEMSQVGERIAKTDLKPGDLVFFNTRRRSFSHVGIYVGGNKFVHAPATGGKIRVEDLRKSYWLARYNGARRVEMLKASSGLMRVEQLFKHDHPM